MWMIWTLFWSVWATSLPAMPTSNRSYLRWADRVVESGPEVHPESAYAFYSELHAQIAQHVRERPGVIQPEKIGQTLEGRPIWAFHLSNPRQPIDRKVLITSQIHALEWMGAEVAVDLISALVVQPEPGVQVTIVPVINVDGRLRVEADLLAGRNLYRRGNAAHVDLNRDFAEQRAARAVWRHILPSYYRTSPDSLSQPESRAIASLAEREQFDRALSFHAAGGFIYTPWAGAWERPNDWGKMHALGLQMQAAQGRRPYRLVQLSRFLFFFRGHGMELDHLYARHGTHAFLVELTRGGFIWTQPSSFRNYFRWYNPVDPAHHTAQGLSAALVLVRSWDRNVSGDPKE